MCFLGKSVRLNERYTSYKKVIKRYSIFNIQYRLYKNTLYKHQTNCTISVKKLLKEYGHDSFTNITFSRLMLVTMLN